MSGLSLAAPTCERDAPGEPDRDPPFATRSPLPLRWQRRLSWWTFPAVLGGFVGLAWWGFERGFRPDAWGAGLALANLAVIGGLERLLPRRPEGDLVRDRQSWNDFGHAVFVGLSAAPLGQAAAVFAVAWAARTLEAAGWQGLWPAGWPLPAQVLIAVLLWGLADYWVHRAFHEIDRLWWAHALHHDTPQMHVLKSLRLHWSEEIFHYALQPIPLLLLGAPETVMVWLALQNSFIGNLQHSNLAQRFPSWVHYLVPTVQLHTIHHSRERRLQDSNYAGVIPVWDLVFGSYRHPDRNPVTALGLADAYVPRGFLRQLVFPLWAFWRPPVASSRPPATPGQ